MSPIINSDEAEIVMCRRLAREAGIASTCPKCILHHLGIIAPQLRPEDIFSYTDPLGTVYDWPKAKLERVASRIPVSMLPARRALTILEESSVEAEHLPHIPEEALARTAIVVEVRVGATTRNVFADGNHRATRLAQAGRPVPIHWIRRHQEPQCRASQEDLAHMISAGQRNGFLVWEVPIMYAVSVDDNGRVPWFGRIVMPMEIGSTNAYFQVAANARTLAVPPDVLAAGTMTRPGFVELPLDARPRYEPVARAAEFRPTLRIGSRDHTIIPVPHGMLPADTPRMEARR